MPDCIFNDLEVGGKISKNHSIIDIRSYAIVTEKQDFEIATLRSLRSAFTLRRFSTSDPRSSQGEAVLRASTRLRT